MTRILCALAVISLGGLATGVSPALGAFPGDNGKIAFDSDRDGGDPDIWAMNPNGSNQVNLTASSEAVDIAASWRADGQKIAFMSDRVTATNPETISASHASWKSTIQLNRSAHLRVTSQRTFSA